MAGKWLIVVVGPTALGKTSWGVTLARHYETEIISADSRQFFREMRIGTAVPSEEELAAAKHHLVQHRSIQDPYTVGDFEKETLQLLEELFTRHDEVLLVGGSGLYINAVTQGLDHFPEVPAHVREELNQKQQQYGLGVLQDELKELDPDYYHEVDLDNPHRVIRALEVCYASGRPYSAYRKRKKVKRDFRTIFIGLEAPRELVYERIEARVDLMINNGLLEEARKLHSHKHLNALQTVGYRELFKYFEGEWDLQTAIDEIKKNTRRFAKRQLTWFRKNKEITWIAYNEEPEKVIAIIERLKKDQHEA
ncbi:MAG: tRNA (adenosine(37)-N6)-dimethylallyltransferase MiaA [Flavobacteriaceae bacterium]|nr:tRNA (adenosine(37)-N6)-dimethylallyltransferase MiaA [Flavobacteriaceae bacterium]